MSREKRQRFAQRANQASERRVEMEKLQQEELKRDDDLKTKHVN